MAPRSLLVVALVWGAASPASAAAQQPPPVQPPVQQPVPLQKQLQLKASSKDLLPATYTFSAPLPTGFAVQRQLAGGHAAQLTKRAGGCTTVLVAGAATAKTKTHLTARGLADGFRRNAARYKRVKPVSRERVKTRALQLAPLGSAPLAIPAATDLVQTSSSRGLAPRSTGSRARLQVGAVLVAPLNPPGARQRAFQLLLFTSAQPHTPSCAATSAMRGARASAAILAGAKLTQSS